MAVLDKVDIVKKFRGKFCDFGAMITKGVRNERNNLAGFCNPGYFHHHRRDARADDRSDYEG